MVETGQEAVAPPIAAIAAEFGINAGPIPTRLNMQTSAAAINFQRALEVGDDDDITMAMAAILKEAGDMMAPPPNTKCHPSRPIDPTNRRDAMTGPDAPQWKRAEEEEVKALNKNKTWTMVWAPDGAQIVKSGFVYKIKTDENGKLERYKARFVAKGYSQIYGIDFNETFAPVVRGVTLRVALALGLTLGFRAMQVDVKNAYLHGTLDETIYMQPPPQEYLSEDDHGKVCRLLKTLYGLRQSGRGWNTELHDKLVEWGFTRSESDRCLYTRREGGKLVQMVCVFVDDCLVLSRGEEEENFFKARLGENYEYSGGEGLHWFVGIKFEYDAAAKNLSMSQTAYIDKLIETFRMTGADTSTTTTPMEPGTVLSKNDSPKTEEEKADMAAVPYRSLVGALRYLADFTRPDIACAVGDCCRFLSNPGRKHWEAAQRILRYVKGTRDDDIVFQIDSEVDQEEVKIEVWSDADFGGDPDRRRSKTGWLIKVNGCLVGWRSALQSTVATSTMEAEYMALGESAKESRFVRELIEEIQLAVHRPVVHYEDNQPAVALSKDQTKRGKNVEIMWHSTRQMQDRGEIVVVYCPTREMIADIFTKALPRMQFEYLRTLLGMRTKLTSLFAMLEPLNLTCTHGGVIMPL